MAAPILSCISATTFSPSGELDEEAFRRHLNRLIDSRIGVFLGSGGNGESHSLAPHELRRIYEIGVEECKGKVAIEAHLPEESNPRTTIEQARVAIAAGIEVVQVYTPEGRHGYVPTDRELTAYYDQIFSDIRHPSAIIVSRSMGYIPRAEVVADVCRKHGQVVAILLALAPDTYLLDLKSLLNRSISIHCHFMSQSLSGPALGADGLFTAEANIIPKTTRQFIDLQQARKLEELGHVLTNIVRFGRHVRRWSPANARWIKMAMKVLKLPGGEGGLRPPYLMPPDDEVQAFADGLLRLHIPEIEEMARGAGLAIPTS